MKLNITIIFIVLLFLPEISNSQSSRIDLNEGWQFRRVGDTVWYPAIVPGCVHTDLYNNHLISDPFYGDNEKQLQWIENEDWEYRKIFEVNDSILKQSSIEIYFDGLDTHAYVLLNSTWKIESDNMFMPLRQDVKYKLIKGINTLNVFFESPIKMASKLKRQPELPGGDQVYMRKSPYQYGWDWGPRYVTSGIWNDVYLQLNSAAWLEFINLTLKKLNDNEAIIAYEGSVIVHDQKKYFTFEIVDENELNEYVSDSQFDVLLDFKGNRIGVLGHDILYKIKGEFKIERPRLWWCNGLGEPYLYKLKAVLSDNGNKVDERKLSLGIRTIELDQSSQLSGGSNFQFKLNGEPVYIKGANYVPPNSFPSSVTKKDYERLIDDAVSSNFNMLRVWGGGYYESDEFYNLCDEKGIMVWQDFMFACAMYPGDAGFTDNVKAEARENVSRLRNHPCIALWCGNNEIDEGWHNWGWQEQFKYSPEDSAKIWNNYLNMFEKILPNIVKDNSGGVPYIPTSPKIGWGYPESMKEGDSHYWGVWWGNEPFETYEKKVPRFMSEFGFQSLPDKKTIDAFAKPEDEYLGSPVMKAHQKHPVGYETIQKYMEREYKQPKDFDSYIYVSQLLQAYGIKRAIEAERRAKPYCMGTLYWQFNDCWPVVSWSGIDYFGRWKALQYFVKDAYRDILVSPYVENGNMNVYVVSDRLQPATGMLKLKLIDFEGNVLWYYDNYVKINAGESKVCYHINIDELKSFGNTNQLCFISEITDDRGIYNSNKYYFTAPKDLILPDPGLKYDFAWDGKSTLYLSITSTKLAKNIHIDFDSMDVKLEKNYFDIMPGETKNIFIWNVSDYEMLKRNIRFTTLRDSY